VSEAWLKSMEKSKVKHILHGVDTQVEETTQRSKHMTTPKRQFKAGPKTRTFYDRKVRHEGYTQSLSLGKVIPKDWQYVRIRVVQKTANFISLEILKLMGAQQNGRQNNNT